jgi:hypothetical protein
MNKLLNICIALWIVPFLGKQYFPEIFGAWYIQWPAVILLSVLLPIGFAKTLSFYYQSKPKSLKSILRPTAFLLIFCALQLMQLPVYYVSTKLFSIQPIFVASDTSALDALSMADTEEKRKISAQIIFHEYGKKVPYKLNSGKFVIYEPTKSDKSIYEESRKIKQNSDTYKSLIINSSIQTIYIQAIEITCFFLLFTITLILEQSQQSRPR